MKEKDVTELKILKDYPGERRIVPQDARRNLVEMCRARGGPKKIKGST